MINKDKDILVPLKLIVVFTDKNCMAEINMDKNEMRDEPEVDNENMNDRTEARVPDTIGPSEGDATEKSDLSECDYEYLSQPYVADRRELERDDSDRRIYERIGFTYPLKLKIFSSQLTNTSFNGYIVDISVSGAGIKFEDRYGRVHIDGISGTSVKLHIRMPHGDDIALLSTIKWISRDIINNKFIVKIGIEFQRLEDWQLKAVKQLIRLKNKDQNMMWNLFENYDKNIK